MSNLIVKMSCLKAVQGNTSLKTNSLGSCVGILLYDKTKRIGGMAHIMLPETPIGDIDNVGTYADTAIPRLLEQMEKLGADTSNIKAMIFGGADMFFYKNIKDTIKIGFKNVEICKEILNTYQIPLIFEDSGGSKGRSVEFKCQDGTVMLQYFDSKKRLLKF